MTTRVRVLHVDDDPNFAELSAAFLEYESEQFAIDIATDTGDALAQLDSEGYDCMVAGYEIPETNGIDLLRQVRDTHPDLPFVMFAEDGSEAVASKAISAGVTDYLRRDGDEGEYTLLADRVATIVTGDRTDREAASRERLMRHAETVGKIGGWELDLARDTVRWTAGMHRLLGVPEGEAPDSLDEALLYYHPDDRAAVRATLEQVRETREPASNEWRVRPADGDDRLATVTIHPVETDGELVALRSVIDDVTEQRGAGPVSLERALDALAEPFYVADADGTLRHWNDTLPSVTGYSDDDLDGMPVPELVSDADRERVAEAVSELSDSDRVTVEAELVAADGERLPHTLTASRLSDTGDEHVGFAGVGHGPSETGPSQFDLELSEMAFRHTGTPTFLVDVADAEEFTVERVNQACADLTGRDHETVRGRPLTTLFDDDEAATVRAQCRNCLEQQGTVTFELRQDIDGQQRVVEVQLDPVVRRGRVTAMVGTLDDVTERGDRAQDLTHYEHLVENLPVGVFRATADGEFVSANDALLSTYGAESKAALRTAGETAVYADETHRELVLEQLAETDSIENKLLQVESLDGEQKWVEASLSMTTEDGDRYVDGIVREPDETGRQTEPPDTPDTSSGAGETLSVVNTDDQQLLGTLETDGSGETRESVEGFFAHLHNIATDTELAFKEKLDRVIGHTRRYLDADVGFLTRIERDAASGIGVQTIVELSGDHDALQPGESCPLSEAYCRKTIRSDGLLSIADSPKAGWEDDPAYERFGLGSYIGGTVVVDDEVYGTICFASEQPRAEPFDQLERVMVRLLSWWASYELEQERLNEQFEQFADAVPDALFLTASDYSELHYANAAAESLYGVDETHLRADPTSWARNVHPDDHDKIDPMLPVDGEVTEPQQQEVRIQHPDRGTRWVELGLYPVDTDGGADRLAGVARDVTEQVNSRQRLEMFASVVSHDLRNPLSAAVGYLDLVKRECECDIEYLDDIQRSHERMETLIENLLALARNGEQVTASEPVDISELSEQCWRTVDTEEARLVVETDRIICADPSRLQQLFENMYRNAVEHGGDAVTIRVGELENGFYIDDDGAGIAAEERERLFEMGYGSDGGTGFGLSIIEQIADAHGWTVQVTDGPDGGARFEITGVEDPGV